MGRKKKAFGSMTAEEWLAESLYLAGEEGALVSSFIAAGEDAGFSRTTIFRAAKNLNVVRHSEVIGGGQVSVPRKVVRWSLPKPRVVVPGTRVTAKVWLREFLGQGQPVEISEVLTQGREAGYSRATLYRAAKELDVQRVSEVVGERHIVVPVTSTRWELPRAAHHHMS